MSREEPSERDLAEVSAALGRPPAGRFLVALRDGSGRPLVIENEPHLLDGTPMPTLFWLVDPSLHDAVSRLEAQGGVHRFESLVGAEELAAAHAAYALEREGRLTRQDRPAPFGGVGGTRTGVKCLHAHLAYYLVGGEDPVGALVAQMLEVDHPRQVRDG